MQLEGFEDVVILTSPSSILKNSSLHRALHWAGKCSDNVFTFRSEGMRGFEFQHPISTRGC